MASLDKHYMSLALKLARDAFRHDEVPVGAILVVEGKICGWGSNHRMDGNHILGHAEIIALETASSQLGNWRLMRSTLYVTLEPCSHYGKTPPCADKIIEKKIKRVVIGTLDPNPLVSGNGVKKLVDAGIEVKVGVLEDRCKKINKIFMKYIKYKEPFVVMKAAMSLDGKICTVNGESKWITGEKSREHVHKTRALLSAIMVGVDTVIKDNPSIF